METPFVNAAVVVHVACQKKEGKGKFACPDLTPALGKHGP